MTSPAIATVKNGKIELLNPFCFPEGTQLLVTPIPVEENRWSRLRYFSLVWIISKLIWISSHQGTTTSDLAPLPKVTGEG